MVEQQVERAERPSRRVAAALICAAAALALSDVWFDMAGHGTAFIAANHALSAAVADGHTLFLVGMLGLVALQALAPRWFEQHLQATLWAATLLGVAAALGFCKAAGSNPPVTAGAVVVIGCVNALQLNYALLLLSTCPQRRLVVFAAACAVAAKTLAVSGANHLAAPAQEALFVAVPLAFALCCVAHRRIAALEAPSQSTPMKFQRPLSTVMLGILVASSVVFATTRAVSSMGFWGTGYALTTISPLACILATALFLGLCYVTIANLNANLLFRFLPGLMVLFAAYGFLYAGIGEHLGLGAAVLDAAAQYAELYGEVYAWAIILLAVRTLRMPPLRVISLQFVLYSVVEIALQVCIERFDSADMIIVSLCFCLIMAVLMGVLYRFYGIQGFGPEGNLGTRQPGVPQLEAHVPPPAQTSLTLSECRLAFARTRGLSDRETEVFLLLAQGRSRRFIADELFISEGTVSKHSQRIYEKLGVHSKQELLSMVHDNL